MKMTTGISKTQNPKASTLASDHTQRLSVTCVAMTRLPTRWGEFKLLGYQSRVSEEQFLALTLGQLHPDVPALIRIHSQCLTGEVFGSMRCECAAQFEAAMDRIQNEGNGVLVYQFQEGRGIGIINKIRAYAFQDAGADTVEANEYLGLAPDARVFDQCVEVLIDLNVRKVRVMSNNPQKVEAISSAGLEIIERVHLPVQVPLQAMHYLRTKQDKLGHLL